MRPNKRMFLSAETNFIYAIDMDISECHLLCNRAVHMKHTHRVYLANFQYPFILSSYHHKVYHHKRALNGTAHTHTH